MFLIWVIVLVSGESFVELRCDPTVGSLSKCEPCTSSGFETVYEQALVYTDSRMMNLVHERDVANLWPKFFLHVERSEEPKDLRGQPLIARNT